jgi:hypothetical protein
MGLLYGRAGRLSTENAGSRPGQFANLRVRAAFGAIEDPAQVFPFSV